jgi:glycerol-3-phosphate dehydrogenase (NAD(P)+)
MSERGATLGIVGAGPFGTALGALVAGAGRRALLWSTTAEVVDEINRRHTNAERLPGVELAPGLTATHDPAELAAGARFIVLAVGSTEARGRARNLGEHVDGSHMLVHAIGALEGGTNLRISDVLREETPVIRVGALAGPALAQDLVERQLASMVLASRFDDVAAEGRRLLGVPPTLRVYGGRDLIGVELAAAFSGAYTVALGIADAMRVGPGPRAVLVTRAIAEASRFGEAVGAEPRTFSGLAGLGNLLVRASSDARERSRDYQVGLALGRETQPAALMRAEGVRAAGAAARYAAKIGVRVPLLAAVDRIARGEVRPVDVGKEIARTVASEE